MKKVVWVALFGFALVLSSSFSFADVSLPALFSDNMVLQQGVKVPVWGWAGDGEEVTVSFQGKEVSTKARGGKWKVNLRKLKAGGPYDMTVAGSNTISISNVLVGEVWVCGGQSNMQWPLSKAENATDAIENSKSNSIRLFQVAVTGADEPQEDVEGQWVECGPDVVANFSAVGYFFGRELDSALDAPIGLIQSCLGGTNASSWVTREVLESNRKLSSFLEDYGKVLEGYPEAAKGYEKRVAQWKEKQAKARAEGNANAKLGRYPQPPMGPEHVKRPNALYYAMIAPLQPYAIKGAIWYQGESNAKSNQTALQYRELFPSMIKCWREEWGQGSFPFLFVQLAPFGNQNGDAWPLLREAQTRTLSLRNTGMAVIMDIGEEDNIHPVKKQEVGQRLALAARHVAYGEDIVYSGPVYSSMRVKGSEAVLKFKHGGGGLTPASGELKGFTVAGKDREFVDAEARIVGDTVVVSSPKVEKPAAVRYGWAAYIEANLANKEGLPASPFRTDNFDFE